MRLFRVFNWDGRSSGSRAGGPLFVPRVRQGSGRHDAPEVYGAWYLSRSPEAAVAESIQFLRGHTLRDTDFQRSGGAVQALTAVELDEKAVLVDLDDPAMLVARGWRPSQVATRERPVTQAQARAVFGGGADGLIWWSTLESSWLHVTLFAERARRHVRLVEAPRALSVALPEVAEAAGVLGIALGSSRA